MSQYKDAAIGDTVHFWFAANLTTGAAGDGATPLYDVRLAGAAAGAAPVLSGTPTLLSHADYTDGLHEIAVAATEGNGFAAGNEYAVFCSLTISTVNPAGFVGSFKLRAAGKTIHDAVDAIFNSDYGLAHLVRSTTPANALAVDAAGKIAVPDTQKVDVNTIKTQTITCIQALTILANLGFAGAPGANDGAPTTNGTKINQTADLTSGQSIALTTAAQNALVAAIEVELANDATGQAFMQAIADKIASDWTVGDVSVAAIATAVRDAILNRVLSGNHDTAGTPGKLIQNLNDTITSRMASFSYTAPDNTNIGNIIAAINNGTYGLSPLKTLIDAIGARTSNLPANPAAVGSQMDLVNSPNATAITALQNGLATSAALALAKTILDNLATMIELDGEVYRLTVNALEMSPAGEGGGNTIVFPVMQGQVYTATAVQKRTVEIIRGDTPTISFDLNADYTGWTPYFGAKSALADSTYVINPKAGSWVTAANGEGTVELTATETATAGQYYAEIELRRGESKLTAMQYLLTIKEDVIK